MDGFLLVDKPEGISSFGVVARVRGMIRQAAGQKIKIGHTGTLDPAATGLMILVIGAYTKKAQMFSKLDKTYEAEITFGFESSTGDREGDLTKISDDQPSRKEVVVALNKFVGKILQTPPIFSAIKVDGQRAYKLARDGKIPELKPRQATVYGLQVSKYQYPKLRFTVEVSSGTYIRSLAEDIGKQLGIGGYLSNLRRTKIGELNIKSANGLAAMDFEQISANLQQGL